MTTVSAPSPTTRDDRPGRGRAVLVTALAALLLAAAVAAAGITSATEQGSATFAATDLLQVTGGALDLTVVEGAGDDIDVSWTAARSPWRTVEVSVTETDGTVVVAGVCGGIAAGRCAIEMEVRVPEASLERLEVDVAAGAVLVVGTTADVVAATQAGSITLAEHAGARAQLRTTAGSVTVDAVTAPTQLDVLVDAGDVEIVLPDADYDLVATTGVGSASTSVREVEGAPHEVRVRVEVGDVDVTMR